MIITEFDGSDSVENCQKIQQYVASIYFAPKLLLTRATILKNIATTIGSNTNTVILTTVLYFVTMLVCL